MHFGILCSPRYKYIFLKLTPPNLSVHNQSKICGFCVFDPYSQKHNNLIKYTFIKNVIQLYKIAFN